MIAAHGLALPDDSLAIDQDQDVFGADGNAQAATDAPVGMDPGRRRTGSGRYGRCDVYFFGGRLDSGFHRITIVGFFNAPPCRQRFWEPFPGPAKDAVDWDNRMAPC
ncbi:hypothetical protein JCM12296A_20180 [Desulfosarcina cetonica]